MNTAVYTTTLFIHILAGLTWVGSNIFFDGTMHSVLKRHGQVEADRVLERLAWSEKALFIPAPLTVVVTGIIMVLTNEGIRFSNLWVVVSLGLFLLSLVLAGGIGSRMYKQIEAHREAGTVDTPEYGTLLHSMLRLTSIETVATLVIVSMMVFRPT